MVHPLKRPRKVVIPLIETRSIEELRAVADALPTTIEINGVTCHKGESGIYYPEPPRIKRFTPQEWEVYKTLPKETRWKKQFE